MSSSLPLTVRVDAGVKDQIDSFAKQLDRPRSWVISQALERYLSTQSWQIAELQDRLKQADAGEFAAQKDVDAFFSQWKK